MVLSVRCKSSQTCLCGGWSRERLQLVNRALWGRTERGQSSADVALYMIYPSFLSWEHHTGALKEWNLLFRGKKG